MQTYFIDHLPTKEMYLPCCSVPSCLNSKKIITMQIVFGKFFISLKISFFLSPSQRMQQPLAHLYFLTVLEHLQAKGHNLSGLVRTANTITQQCASPTTESVVLWIELQAVVQVILRKLAVHFNPSKPHMEEIHPMVDDINR